MMEHRKKEKLREVPLKNYIYLFLVILITILLLGCIYKWNIAYNNTKLNTSVMNNYLTIINYNELKDYIVENKDAVVYVSIVGNAEINKFEQKFKTTIIDNNLKNNILYLDLTYEDIESATKELNMTKDFPQIIVFTNEKITDVYNIKKNKYDIPKTVKYLNRIGVIEND